MTAPRKLLVLFLVLCALPLVAQTTGSVNGRVIDSSSAPLPGVTVEAKSSALQGTRTTVSDPAGLYRLPLLPPGDYSVTFTLQGFATKQKKVSVGLGKELAIDVSLSPSVSSEITVTADAPVIDTSSGALGMNLTERAIETLPTGRDYTSIVQVTPGVSSDANPTEQRNSITVYGSSGAENSFFIDGVN